jgi:hypothetical protein
VALLLVALGAGVLAAVLGGLVGSTSQVPGAAPPAVLATAATPVPTNVSAAEIARRTGATGEPASAGGTRAGTAAARSARKGGIAGSGRAVVSSPTSAQQRVDAVRFLDQTVVHIPARWMEGFYPIYAKAQSTFGVNWLLLASVHKQESAFSTAPTTYHGLNFAGCCGGPMQFNVTNGPVSTWKLFRSSYRYARRPAAYDHQTARHPSLYDDFDAIMAAAHLLSSDGANLTLGISAWWAAYDYYGHDATGVTYADQVLARAIWWSQHGFCINCGLDAAMVQAVHAAYGAPVLASLTTAVIARARHGASRRHARATN